MSTKAKEIIENLVEEGFDLSQIADAMCDGEYLESAKIDQETVEEIYTVCVEQNS